MFSWYVLVAVGVGGFLGANTRYLIAGWTQNLWRFDWFPLGTITVNLIGSFLLGAAAGWNETIRLFSPSLRAFLIVGFLGSFTTFSTFSFETLQLIRAERYLPALVNGVGQMLLGIVLAFLGYQLVMRNLT